MAWFEKLRLKKAVFALKVVEPDSMSLEYLQIMPACLTLSQSNEEQAAACEKSA